MSFASEIIKDIMLKIGFSPVQQFGVSGTDISGGQILEDIDQNLSGIQGAETFDQMRRTDSQIAMVLDVIKSPIKTAQFLIEPVDETPEAKADAELIEHILFRGMDKTWQEFLTEFLSVVEFGFAPFEIVIKNAVNSNFGEHVGLKALAWRSPKTIDQWNVRKNGDLKSIRQQVTGDISKGPAPVIPAKKLLLFSYAREGDNFQGISLLRAVHSNYIAKRNFKKIQEIGSQRAATGIPIGKFPANIPDADRDAFISGLKNFSSTAATNHLAIPTGPDPKGNDQVGLYDVEIAKIEHDSDALNNSIERENREIANRAMEGFMMLGQGGSSGSYALGSDLSDIFLGNIESYANLLTDVINKRLIPFFVDINRGERTEYPKLTYSGVNDKAGKELIEILQAGATAGVIQVTPKLTKWVHAAFGLPEPDDISIPAPAAKAEVSEQEMAAFNDKMQSWFGKWAMEQFAQVDLNKKSTTAKLIDSFESKYEKSMSGNLAAITSGYIDRVVNAVVGNPVGDAQKNARQVEFKGRRAYDKELDILTADQLDRATKQTSGEFSDIDFSAVDDVNAPSQGRNKVKSQRQSVIDTQLLDIQKIVVFQVGNTYDKDDVGAEMLREALEDKTESAINRTVKTGAVNLSASVTNAGRNAVYQSPKVLEQIESFVFANHDPKSPICTQLTGRVFTKAEYLNTEFLPPLHHGCKSYIVAQRVNQSKKRPINEIGLGLTGTETQQEATLKSATFV